MKNKQSTETTRREETETSYYSIFFLFRWGPEKEMGTLNYAVYCMHGGTYGTGTYPLRYLIYDSVRVHVPTSA